MSAADRPAAATVTSAPPVPRNPTRHIVHADMDAFYASVEQHDNPELRGKPVLVGGSPRARGVVAAASYESRVFGCRSAMPMRTAARLCPHAEIVRPRFNRYREVSEQIMDIFRSISPLVEPLSMDEAFIDITQRVESGQTPREVAAWIKQRVRKETGLTISCGCGTSKSIAKIASDRDKPDGLTVVPPGEERAFLAPLPISELWGIGPKTAQRLREMGLQTIGDLAERPLPWLIDRFGARGEWFHELACGIDRREVSTDHETKSISSETTFAEDIGSYDKLAAKAREQARDVSRRLRRSELRARTVQIKLRLSDFTTLTRQRTLPGPSDDADEISAAALALLREQCAPSRRFRLIGVGVSNLEAAQSVAQLSLFDAANDPAAAPPASTQRRARGAALRAAVDDLQDRFGAEVVHLGAGDDD